MSVEVFSTEVVEGEIVIPDLLGTSPADLIQHEPPLPQVTEAEAREETDWVHANLATYVEVRERIGRQYRRQEWKTLHYDSWFEFLDREYGDLLRQLARRNRASRLQAVQDMRAQGMSTRQIAQATGVSVGTVHSDLAGVQQLNTSTPEKVTGSDGKEYPAKREAKPVEEPARLTGSGQSTEVGTKSSPAEPVPSTQDKPVEGKPSSTATSAVAEKLDKFLGEDPALKVASWRKGFASAIHGSFQVAAFTPDQVAANADRSLLDEVLRLAHDINDYARRCEEAWNKANGGLRLVGGQK